MKLASDAALRTKLVNRRPLFLLLVIAVLPLYLVGAQTPGKEVGKAAGSADTLMLVREWDADKGLLIGWLPTHFAAIQLQLLGKASIPQFEVDQAVYLTWPRMRDHESEDVHLRVSPAIREFEGQTWLPVKRDPNLVRIGKSLYLVRGIVLNGAKWRFPAKRSMAERNTAANGPGR